MKEEHYIGRDFDVIPDKGGDLVLARRRAVPEVTREPRYPLAWMTPRVVDGMLAIGPGLALMSASDPSGARQTSQARMALFEPFTVDWQHDSPVTYLYPGGVTYEAPFLLGVSGAVMPETWTCVTASFDCATEAAVDGLLVTILGGMDRGRPAIAEKLQWTNGVTPVYTLARYPYPSVLTTGVLPGYTLAGVAAYFLTETEITDDPDL